MNDKIHEIENGIQVALMQAMLGAISSNVRMITLNVRGDNCNIKFFLEFDSESDKEEADDIADELSCLIEGYRVDADVHIISGDLAWPTSPTRPVYRRKESD